MKPHLPRVSVIAPCYNQGQFLAQHLASVARATQQYHEVVVVDDGSDHGQSQRQLDQLRPAAPHQRLILVRQKNRGLAGARNAGLRTARGAYVKFLDADDLLLRGAIDRQMEHLESLRSQGYRAESAAVSICDYSTLDESSGALWPPTTTVPSALGRVDFEAVAMGWERGVSIPIHCALFAREVLGVDPFDEGLRSKEDWLFWMTLLASGAVLQFLHAPLAVYRVHAASMTRGSNVPNAINWLAAVHRAQTRFPDLFTEAMYAAAVEHFKTFYVQRLWAEIGPSFPWKIFPHLIRD